ncbi:hypothetical protein [Hymenobacter aerophilus]|uniref:hypothetical protein n=1 Tax=Hymenobacter aerophilus TaxID=119644 RepID=UPI000373928D|nr:hypothetical protein [Hymenobacter aerophilus]
MKNVLLALALFAFTASAATASEGDKGAKNKKTKKATTEAKASCAMAGSPSCCMKKDAKTSTAATTPAPAAKPVAKSL